LEQALEITPKRKTKLVKRLTLSGSRKRNKSMENPALRKGLKGKHQGIHRSPLTQAKK
jgi:hypothetical protein